MVSVDYYEIVAETALATRFRLDKDDADSTCIWLPKSQITVWEKEKLIEIPEWLAEEKGL